MSEKLCALLLRLYPAAFRQRHGEEALRLMLERARDEKGALRQLRLCGDLIGDLLATSLQYASESRAPQLARTVDGPLSFHFVGGETPSASSLSIGFMISLLILVVFPFGIRGSASAGNSNFPHIPAVAGEPVRNEEPKTEPKRPSIPKIDAAKRHAVIQSAAAKLKERYADPALADKMAKALQTNESIGAYDRITDSLYFAHMLTQHLQEASQDKHVAVVYVDKPGPDGRPGPSSDVMKKYRARMLQENCTFEKVEMLPGRIGYLKLNSFPQPALCKDTAVAAMASLNEAQAVVLDLRENRSGFPEMVSLMASYFFDHREYLYNPREDSPEKSWTNSPVPDNKLADKPLYILTSWKTASTPEQFAYNLKMRKRATLVGETTKGRSHAATFYRIDEHFGMGIPAVKPVNPFGKSDWEGVGVEPNVSVRADEALKTAVALARKRLGH